MKKLKSIIICQFIAILLFSVTACGTQDDKEKAEDIPEKQQKEEIDKTEDSNTQKSKDKVDNTNINKDENTVEPEKTTELPKTDPEVSADKLQDVTDSGVKINKGEGIYYTVSRLNVRSDCNIQGKILGTLEKGEQVQVIGICENGWMQILYGGEKRYVSGNYLSDKPLGMENSGDAEFEEVKGTYYATVDTNIHSECSADSEVVKILKKGNPTGLISIDNNGWMKVYYYNEETETEGKGYAEAKYTLTDENVSGETAYAYGEIIEPPVNPGAGTEDSLAIKDMMTDETIEVTFNWSTTTTSGNDEYLFKEGFIIAIYYNPATNRVEKLIC